MRRNPAIIDEWGDTVKFITKIYYTSRQASGLIARVHLECDTPQDLPATRTFAGYTMIIGSTAHVISTNHLYMMQSGGSWIRQDAASRMDVYTTGQVDELIAGRIPYEYGVEIVAAAAGDQDLDNYDQPGTYNSTAASAQNTLHTPAAPNGAITGYRMDVMQVSATLVQQILRENGASCYVYIRNSTTGGSWSPWYQVSDWGIPRGIAANTDLNDYTQPGSYYCGGSTSGTLANNPASGQAIRLEIYYLNGTNRLIQKIIPATNSAFVIYYRQFTSSGWQSWYSFTGNPV